MAEQKIEFRKTRDFGENLNDTFLFIRLNFMPLFKSFFAICAIFMLTQAILNGLYESGYGTIQRLIYNRNSFSSAYKNYFFDVRYYIIRIVNWLTLVSVQVSSGAYIKYYVENNGRKPGIEDVWSIFRKYYFKVLFQSLPIIILVALGLVLCVVPGIYLSVVFIPFSVIAIVEDTSLADTYSRCFALIRNNFWVSFLIYFVTIIICLIGTTLTGLIISAVMGFVNYFTSYNLTAAVRMLTSFFGIFYYCYFVIVGVSVALQYYNLAEEKDGSGIMDRINKIGYHKDAIDNGGEEY